MPEEEGGSGQAPVARFSVETGASLRTLYVERTVKAFAVSAHELRSISYWNSLALVFFSLGSGLLTFGLGAWVSVWIQPEPWSAHADVMAKVVFPVSAVIAGVFYLLGLWTLHMRRSELDAIQKESRPAEST